jgi:hypothetical protein
VAIAVAALVGFLIGMTSAPSVARADKISDQLRAKYDEAMEAFDGFEYEEARQILNSAVLLAKKNRAGKNKQLARVHLGLGIVYFAGFEEPESAKLAFLEALTIDPAIEIPAGYRSKEMDKLLDDVRSELGITAGGGTGDTGDTGDVEPSDDVDCDAVEGIKHTMVDEAKAGANKELVAHVQPTLEFAKVVLYYRPKGDADFTEVKMAKSGGCRYTGSIPAKAFVEGGEFVHYYIAALNGDGKPIASRGSAGLPNIIEVSGAAAGGGVDDDNPLGIEDKKGGDDKTPSGKKARVFVSVAVGSGGGYVSGDTEQVESPVQCCFAPALLHLFPEIGFYVSQQTSVAVAFRMGFPVGANRDGHATAAPAGFIHLRHALSADGEGFHVAGVLGGGIIRHTVQLTDVTDMEGDVDTVASGPLFVGTGAGLTKSLGGPVRFLAELNILAGLPVASLGDVEPGFAVQFDANLGLLFAF